MHVRSLQLTLAAIILLALIYAGVVVYALSKAETKDIPTILKEAVLAQRQQQVTHQDRPAHAGLVADDAPAFCNQRSVTGTWRPGRTRGG